MMAVYLLVTAAAAEPPQYCNAFAMVVDGEQYTSRVDARGPGIQNDDGQCEPLYEIPDATWWTGCIWKETHVLDFDPNVCGPASEMTVFVPGSYSRKREARYECCRIAECTPRVRMMNRNLPIMQESIGMCIKQIEQSGTATGKWCLRALITRPLCRHEVAAYFNLPNQ